MKKLVFSHKDAFTMIELVFVIVMIGIMAAVLIPRAQNNRLREAADQVISHIRYTQHLAMMDDKFDPADDEWYKGRWQIYFIHQAMDKKDTTTYWGYTIFSDTPKYAGKPEFEEIATNPLNPAKKLHSGSSTDAVGIKYNDAHATNELNLEKKYGVTDVEFSNSCSIGIKPNNSKRLAFDYLGRPMKGDISTSNASYQIERMITTQCNITLHSSSAHDNITISIEPETGFAFIAKK